MRLLAAAGVDFWRWQPHPEVWVLVGGVIALSVYALRVVGPKVVPKGRPVATGQQLAWLSLGIVLLWVASDWPLHDIAEECPIQKVTEFYSRLEVGAFLK